MRCVLGGGWTIVSYFKGFIGAARILFQLERRPLIVLAVALGWARFADRIVVLQDGAIAEEGTHDSLLHAEGAYAAMFRAQSAW
ncbi:hypothetical protein [Paenibacillus cremeus]|uniref:ABC transporter ATP-binding protein n=1 Tax=Paenibacillus cremeus TaxID=2163881 RepID=A0A559KFH5_9BACL|nr:hypothetical protein [Paenibacillus cremeus]TVY10875.1 hypothetical protein FPZ49_05160 [Paenibacillus cremeus]